MAVDQEQTFLYDLDGQPRAVARDARERFEQENPGATRVRLFSVDGKPRAVAADAAERFASENPGAEPVYLFDRDGKPQAVAKSGLGRYIGSRAAPDKDRSWGSYAGEAYADAAKAVGRTVAAAGAGVAQGIGGTLADLGPGDAARRERQRALDAAPERIPTMKEAGRQIGLSQAEIDALPDRPVTLRDLDDTRFGQAYRDRVRATMNRVAANAPETEAEKAHREEAERLQAKADALSAPLMEPRNAAERAAMHFGGGVATVGELGLASALGGPAAVPLWMGATGAAREAARQEAEGKAPREAMAGALAPAAAEAAAWTVPLPVGEAVTAAGRVGREALTMGVKSDLAGTARRTLSGEEAPALSDRIAEDLGAAAMGGALGAAREGAGAAGRRIVRAAVRDARERAARLAALDPATALGRAAEAVTPPELRETARNLEAAAVPESPMDAYARRRAAAADPLTDYAGSSGREFLERGARDLERREADAARMAEEELATREAPQVAPEEVPPTMAPDVRPRNMGSEPPPAPVAEAPATQQQSEQVLVRGGLRVLDSGETVSFIEKALAKPENERSEYEDDIVRVMNMPTRDRALAAVNEMGLTGPEAYGIDVDTGIQAVLISEWEKRHGVTPTASVPEVQPRNTGKTGNEPPASGGASRPGEPQSPAPAPVAGSATAPRVGEVYLADGRRFGGVAENVEAARLRAAEPAMQPDGTMIVRHGTERLSFGDTPVSLEDYLKRWNVPRTARLSSAVEDALEEAKRTGRPQLLGMDYGRRSDGIGAGIPARFIRTDSGEVKRGDSQSGRNLAAMPDGTLRDIRSEGVRTEDGSNLLWNPLDGGVVKVLAPQSPAPAPAPVAESATPPPAPSRGSARGDVAADTPRLAETARPTTAGTKPATPDGPRTAIRSELQVLLDSGEKDPATLEDLARRAEAADAFATAALARQAAGTYRGTPWGTEGGAWPAEPPPMAKLELGDMVDLARELSAKGAVPKVVRRIARVLGGRAASVFRSDEGVPTSGKVEMLSRFASLVDKGERAAIEDRAQRRAAATGAEPGSEMFREAYDKALADGLGKAVEASLKAGPKPAMAVLAHEIGHWVDFLDEGTLKRGNVLGHIAALKKFGARNLYPSKAAADAAGSPKLTKEEVRARAVEMTDPQESFKTKLDWLKAVSRNESAARAALIAERDMATLPQMREQMERLVAWFRQSDGAPDYFRNDPAELYAEAFSAWMNYPANARRLAPRFADLMDGWIESHGAAGRAVRRFQTMAAERGAARAAAAAAGGTPPVDDAFFERRRKESAAASMAEDPAIRKILSEDKDPIPKWKRNLGAFLNNFVGPRTMLEDLILGAPDAKGNPEALPVFRALQDLDNAGNMGRLWHYRFQTRVMPKLEAAGIPLDDFRDFLKYRRLGWEITGERMEGGAANKFGPGGVSPGYQATGARSRVEALRAKYGRALDDAADTFFDDVRMGADAGGEGSILKRLIESPVLSQAQKDALGNRLYVSLARAMVPDTTREVTSAREMKNWNGIWRLSTGSFQETGDVIANTLLQDATMFPLVMRQEARLRLVDYLREKMPEWVGGPAEMKAVTRTDEDGNPFTQSVPKQQTRAGWRVVTFNRDGKAEGWWLPDFVAKGLEPQTFAADKTTAERDADAAWAKLSRASNASLTTGNLVFNPVNALARDPNGLSRYALPRRGEGAKGALYNTVGDVSLGLRSLFDKTATNLERGVYDPRAVHALASGALNDTAAGWGPTGGTGGIAAMAEDIRRQGRTELTEDELRRFWQGFGNRPERVEAALRKEGSKIEKAAGQVERIWNTYAPGRVNQWLGKREMASKAASLADLEARYPDMTPEERNWWVKNMMGTPDLANRPLYDRNPRFRAAAPFWTPFVHGIRYQVMRAFQRMPGTLGRRLAVQMLPKILAVAAPTIGVLMAKRYYEEWKRMKASGRYSEAALDEQLSKAARWTAFGQAYAGIPLRHRIGGFTAPLPGGYYYYQPTDQGLLALESLALGAVGGATKQGSYKEGILGAVNEFLPNVGPIPNTVIGLATTANGRGFDLNMGTPIVGEREQHPALRTAGWAYNNLTGRGLGILPAETIEGWITGTGPTAGEAAKRAWKLPLLSAFPGAFIRKRGSGEWAARAGATRQEKAEETEMRSEATQGAAAALRVQERARKGESDPAADARDRERTNEAGRRIQELGGDAGARLRSAAERQSLAASDLSPSERLIVEKKGRLSDAAKEWLDPAAHAMLEMPEVWQKLHEGPPEE